MRGESLVWDGSQLLVVRKNQPVDQENEKTIPASLCPVLKKPFPLNGADVELLKTIPGIGEVMAQRIVDKRTQLGKITSIAQLKSIRGVGEKTAALIAKHTTFDL